MLLESGVSDAELQVEANRIAAQVEAVFSRYLTVPGDGRDRLFEAMRHAGLGGGKRVRPLLTAATGRMFGLSEDRVIRAGAAIEAIHVYSLIHDDLPCMDDDDLRRGKPTVHRQFDEATAVLAGDALLTFAFEILADPASHPDPQMRCLLIAGLAKNAGMAGMVGGQAADMAGSEIDSDLIAVTRMNRLKTGALINFSVDAGAVIGCAREDARTALSRYAHDVGL